MTTTVLGHPNQAGAAHSPQLATGSGSTSLSIFKGGGALVQAAQVESPSLEKFQTHLNMLLCDLL